MDHQHSHHHEQHSMDGGGGGGGMMKMYFHFGLGDMLLVRNFVIDSPFKMALVCLAVFLGAILLEAMDYTRGYLSCRCKQVSANIKARKNGSSSSSQDELILNPEQQQPRQPSSCCRSQVKSESDHSGQNVTSAAEAAAGGCSYCRLAKRDEGNFLGSLCAGDASQVSWSCRFLQSMLHFCRTGLALILMLVAMTYNVCLIFPIMLGKLSSIAI